MTKLTYARNGIIGIETSKSFTPLGFWRKGEGGGYYTANLFKIVNGRAQYNSGSNNRTHAMIHGTTLLEKRRKDLSSKILELYQNSLAPVKLQGLTGALDT